MIYIYNSLSNSLSNSLYDKYNNIYNKCNILVIGIFSLLSFIPINYIYENIIRCALLSYFMIDSYKNKIDIILHHILYSLLIIYSPFSIIKRCLIMEWTTFFLLLYKEKYNTKYIFALLWVLIRLIYIPYYFYSIYNKLNMYINNAAVLIYGFHFHWTCKILDKHLNTSYGFSSLLLMIIPLNILDYYKCINFSNYFLLYLQCQISFYFNVIHYHYNNNNYISNVIRSLDNSLIFYTALKYTKFSYSLLVSILFFIYKIIINNDNNLHRYIFVYSPIYLVNEYIFLFPFAFIGLFVIYYKMNNSSYSIIYKYIWHFCSSFLFGFSLIYK